MTRLIGLPGDRWTLPQAVDALGLAARWAGRPGLVWLAGAFYPTLTMTPGLGGETIVRTLASASLVGSAQMRELEEQIAIGVALLPLLLLGFRLTAGLALLGTPGDGAADPPRPRLLSEAWRAGRGMTLQAAGLSLMLVFLMVVAMAFLLGPVSMLPNLGIEAFSFPGYVLVGPLVGILACYGLVLGVVYQLALHSLVHNQRGVASALTHAWRLVRNDPWATVRATLVDVVLLLVVVVLAIVAFTTVCLIPLGIALIGFRGVARAGFWARTYRALGGFTAPEAVPGL